MEMLQKKSTVNIGLSEDNRAAVVERLTRLLADEQVLYTKLRNYHWNVTGIHFQPLHALFETQYTALFALTDEIAERIRSLGSFAIGSMQRFLEHTQLEEAADLHVSAAVMLAGLLHDNEVIIQSLRNDIATVQNLGDEGTTDFLIGLMTQHEKMAWLLRSHLE
jgi:starvation-inducible DNA-binding protein